MSPLVLFGTVEYDIVTRTVEIFFLRTRDTETTRHAADPTYRKTFYFLGNCP